MRRILVTGGGSGIGRAVALDFHRAGEQVVIAGRRAEALAETAAGTSIETRVADVSDEASVAALFDQPFDVVVANAGGGITGFVRDMDVADFRSTIEVNLITTFLTFRAALRAGMPRGGRLIAMASTASLKGGPNISAYVSAKHGLLGLVRSLAFEVAREGITCNAVCPGFVDTDMAEAAVTGVMARFGIDRAAATAKVTGGNPMRRLIDPAEVAAAVRFLASPEASSVNGHALSVSGGEI